MIATNYSQVRDNLKCYMDKVTEDYEPVIITRKNNKNVVMISEEAYNNMLENMHLMGNKANYDWLMESKRQFENGNVKLHEILETKDE
ncbi:Antitoxin YefM [uncultured Eubacterium sp.]|nr:Antitoxin YefM [uncultured Eubacterium sp.]